MRRAVRFWIATRAYAFRASAWSNSSSAQFGVSRAALATVDPPAPAAIPVAIPATTSRREEPEN